jgi:hypothetical protein
MSKDLGAGMPAITGWGMPFSTVFQGTVDCPAQDQLLERFVKEQSLAVPVRFTMDRKPG